MDDLLWFGVLVQAFIVCIMLAIGLQLLPREMAGVLRDRNFLLRTLVINLILIPFSVILLLYFFELPSSLSIAIVLIAAAPGARPGPSSSLSPILNPRKPVRAVAKDAPTHRHTSP